MNKETPILELRLIKTMNIGNCYIINSDWDKFAYYEYNKLTMEDNEEVDGDDVKLFFKQRIFSMRIQTTKIENQMI